MINLFISLKAMVEVQNTGITWFNQDVYTLLFRLVVNLAFLTIIIRLLYYPKTKRKDYLFTYYLIGLITFFLCFGLKKLDLDKTKIHVGVFGADTINKNLHNQVIHSLMIENVIVHVLDKSVFQYLAMDERIVEHGKNLPREQFLAILGSMDINLYMSFNESWGLVAKESEALGVKTIHSNNIDYINTIRLKLKK